MQVFTVKELANYLQCSVSSIRNLVRNREIPFFRVGSKLNFNKEAIDKWINWQEEKNMRRDEQVINIRQLNEYDERCHK